MIKNDVKNDKETVQVIIFVKLTDSEGPHVCFK